MDPYARANKGKRKKKKEKEDDKETTNVAHFFTLFYIQWLTK